MRGRRRRPRSGRLRRRAPVPRPGCPARAERRSSPRRRARCSAASRARCRGSEARAGDGAASCSRRRTRCPASVSAARMRSRSGERHDEQVVDVTGLVLRQLDELAETELGVARGGLAAPAVPFVEMRRGRCATSPPGARRGASCSRRSRTSVLSREPWNAQHLHTVGELVVVRRDEAAVAEAEEVLRREEAVRRGDALRCDAGSAEGLRSVLDHRDAERDELVHRRGPAEQVHRHDRARARRDLRGDVVDVDVHRRRVDVGEDGRRTAARDRLGGRVERERRADDLVAGADLHRVEHDHDRVRAVRDADRLRDAEERGRLLLECPEVRPTDELPAVEDLAEAGLELRDQRRVLRLDVNQRYLRHGVGLSW